jgi:hypothetical protein
VLNSTKDFHQHKLNTLGWELTVCNALHQDGTGIRKILKKDASFGYFLFDHLCGFCDMDRVRNILEIGGGYGYLMRDFLDRNPSLEPVMLDISPVLLEKQRETLKGRRVFFREEDFLETDVSTLRHFDVAIMNENLGDFPTLVDIGKEPLQVGFDHSDPTIRKAAGFIKKYGLELPEGDLCNVNIGALEAVEKLCVSGMDLIYTGEHSCEASPPPALRSHFDMKPSYNPERISLMGHDEYSIRFSHLEQVARSFGYECTRGPFADFIPLRETDEGLRSILASRGRYSDEGEMVYQFVEDLYKYEYLILKRTI